MPVKKVIVSPITGLLETHVEDEEDDIKVSSEFY